MTRLKTSIGNYISLIKNRQIKLFLMILSVIGIVCSSGLAIIFTMLGVDYDGIGKILGVSIAKTIIMISFIVIVLKAYLKINKIDRKPDLIINYLISYFPYLIVFFMQGYFTFSIASSAIETSGSIQSNISFIQLIKYFGFPLVIICLRLSPLVAQYSLNRDFLQLSRGKSMQLLIILTVPIIFTFIVGL